MTDDAYEKALAEALSNPVLAEQLSGLPDDAADVPDALRAIQARLADRAGQAVLREIFESAQSFAAGLEDMRPDE